MARLRIRMELNRGRAGVPLQELARVVGEAQKFFSMLADDVHIDRAAGEWQASNFDNEFLNFTAEFTGPVEVHQIEQFRAAFDGVTLLRRATIAQFARIASALGEDETIAFGLYLNDEGLEPGEWRSLSKRDAMRIDSEIRELLAQSGESDAELATPAVLDTAAVTNLFAGSRERGVLTERIARLETEIARHEEEFEKMRAAAARTDQGLERLVEAVDAFCERATRHMELLPPPAPEKSKNFSRRISVILLLLCAAAGSWLWLFRGNTDPRPADGRVRAADPARVTPPPEPARPPARAQLPTALPPPPPSSSRIIVLKAIEPNWVTVYVDSEVILSKLLNPGESTTLDQPGTFRARLGNAGGVEILVDGKPIGPIGHKGQVVTVEFTGTTFHIVPSGKMPS